MDYEMKLPIGVGEQLLAHTIQKFEVQLKQTDAGPVLVGPFEELENAKDYMIQELKERISKY
ncbi:hypothetical protein [Methanobrevibacter filiformis]|uniref:Uncharacterized protein n=1 Tax=Methanobrevibacter filiformis TaxID=55758 RepID=A0A165ZPV8_9EURY|nr:hypothetical protein [Methanobrevibacter filiformis]KZX11004.1 hypothetical protein MBFIL_15760 [Methanobrevibacter filiformis]